MPLSYNISPLHRLLFIRGSGVIPQIERLQGLRTWLEDPAYPACDVALADFTGIESTPTMAELRELVGVVAARKNNRGPRMLAIVTARPITFGVAREFKEFVDLADVGMEVRVFDSVEGAWTWLLPDQARQV